MRTRLSVTATPGRPYAAFAPKTAWASPWTAITLRGIDVMTGNFVYIVGGYKV